MAHMPHMTEINPENDFFTIADIMVCSVLSCFSKYG